MNFFPKLKETVFSVAPVMAIVIVLGITFAPLGSDSICTFFTGGCFVILGLTLFLLGVDIGILPVGEQSGAALTSRKNLPLLLGVSFLIGFIVTVAEPDVQVLADQVRTIAPGISKWSLIFSIAGGVGFFVALGILRTIVSIPLKLILLVSYLILFIPYGTPHEINFHFAYIYQRHYTPCHISSPYQKLHHNTFLNFLVRDHQY